MKEFKDIQWKQHKIGNGSIQGLLMLDNGIELSVVAGPSMYSTPKFAGSSPDEFSSFEVAVFDTDGKFIGMDDDMVLGWQSRLDIDHLIKKYS